MSRQTKRHVHPDVTQIGSCAQKENNSGCSLLPGDCCSLLAGRFFISWGEEKKMDCNHISLLAASWLFLPSFLVVIASVLQGFDLIWYDCRVFFLRVCFLYCGYLFFPPLDVNDSTSWPSNAGTKQVWGGNSDSWPFLQIKVTQNKFDFHRLPEDKCKGKRIILGCFISMLRINEIRLYCRFSGRGVWRLKVSGTESLQWRKS